MRELSDIYESARASIPLRTFPDRDSLPPWSELDERIRYELDVLQDKILSVVNADELLLASHHRVINNFNRGVRSGFLSGSGDEANPESGGELSQGPFQWGYTLGSRARGQVDTSQVKQFITVTHLLAYEFRQLDMAGTKPLEFLIRNIGPDRADEFGELVFAVPILLNYRRELMARIINAHDFGFSEYHLKQSPAPSHLEYLSHGVVALFDPAPKSWIRVAANLGLATLPFLDGGTLLSEHFQAPLEAASVVARKPIAARTIVRRQMDRIELARRWIGSNIAAVDLEDEELAPITLWDVYQTTQAAAIRGQESYFVDVVANNIVSLFSERVEAALDPEDTRLTYLRRHLPSFTRGFDARSERALDVRALASAAFGRNLSDGLRRFEQGGLYIAGVSQALVELSATVNELHHALESPPAFVRAELESKLETALAGQLMDLFEAHPKLARELFGEDVEYEFFSRTKIQTKSAFDLLRSVLFHVVQAARPAADRRDSQAALLENARVTLQRLIEFGEEPVPEARSEPGSGASPYDVVVDRGRGVDSRNAEILATAKHFEEEFETLTRVMHQLVQRLHTARMLAKTQASFLPDYLDRSGRLGVS